MNKKIRKESQQVSIAAPSTCNEVEEEEYVKQKAMRVEKLERSIVAVTCELSTKNTSIVAENSFCAVKAEIKGVEIIFLDTLRECSGKARFKTGHKAEDEARRHDVLCHQWYYWLRTTTCSEI